MIIDSVILKLASRCNLDCSYCYWFRDESVNNKPAVLTRAAEESFVTRVLEHCQANSVPVFNVLFHGGEPLLFDKCVSFDYATGFAQHSLN